MEVTRQILVNLHTEVTYFSNVKIYVKMHWSSVQEINMRRFKREENRCMIR